MPLAAQFHLSSLRGKLAAAALAGLITTAVLTALLLITASSANEVVRTARLHHERVHAYSQLHTAARDYQGASYNAVRDPGAVAQDLHREAGKRLTQAIHDVETLPALTGRDRTVAARVVKQAREVLDLYRDATPLVRSVDAAWRDRGSRAALLEVNRITTSIYALQATVREEVRRGDAEVAGATAQALALMRITAFGSLLGLALAIVFWLVVHGLLHTRLRPGLRRLEHGAEAFRAGNLDHRIGFEGPDELSRLSAAFDAMAETLAEKQARLHEVQLGLERAVAERTAELQQANTKLSAADERRRAFLADVGHELRTPLTVIRGEAQVALRTSEQRGFDPHDAFVRILQQTQDLSRMVDDLFLIARAEAGGLPLDRKLLDIGEVVERVASDFETLAGESGSTITTRRQGDILALVDPDRLRRALACLIENALRHCQPGVTVEIEVESRGESALIAVADNGPGIDPELAPELFQRFRRGATRGEGTGLGLSLVSALIEAHGGRAWLEQRDGGGTRALMEVPHGTEGRKAA